MFDAWCVRLVVGCLLLVIGCSNCVVGAVWSAVCNWLMPVGCQLFVVG